MLEFAEKYNWWTPQEKKAGISLETKLEYVLQRGPLREWREALREVGGRKLWQVWKEKLSHKDLPKRKKALECFAEAHKND